MKYVFHLCIILILVFSVQSFAQKNSAKNGVGLIVNDPTGISIKFLNTGYRHFNGAIAWSTGNNRNNNNDGYLYLHADYIFNKWRISNQMPTNFAFLLGAGLKLATGPGDASLAVRIPLGLTYVFDEVPIDTFIELVPRLELIPDTDFDVDAAFAIRFLF